MVRQASCDVSDRNDKGSPDTGWQILGSCPPPACSEASAAGPGPRAVPRARRPVGTGPASRSRASRALPGQAAGSAVAERGPPPAGFTPLVLHPPRGHRPRAPGHPRQKPLRAPSSREATVPSASFLPPRRPPAPALLRELAQAHTEKAAGETAVKPLPCGSGSPTTLPSPDRCRGPGAATLVPRTTGRARLGPRRGAGRARPCRAQLGSAGEARPGTQTPPRRPGGQGRCSARRCENARGAQGHPPPPDGTPGEVVG